MYRLGPKFDLLHNAWASLRVPDKIHYDKTQKFRILKENQQNTHEMNDMNAHPLP